MTRGNRPAPPWARGLAIVAMTLSLVGCAPAKQKFCGAFFSGPDAREQGVVNDVEHWPGSRTPMPKPLATVVQHAEATGDAYCAGLNK